MTRALLSSYTNASKSLALDLGALAVLALAAILLCGCSVTSATAHGSPTPSTSTADGPGQASPLSWTDFTPSHAQRLPLHISSGVHVSGVSWAPDGKAFVCSVSYDDPNMAGKLGRRLAVVDLDGSVRFLTRGYQDTVPTWDPHGKWIAFLRAARPSAEAIRASQAFDQALGYPTREQMEKHMPSGKALKLAGESAVRSVLTRLCLLAPEGGPVHELAGGGKAMLGPPAWSPDGHTIAATGLENEPRDESWVLVVTIGAGGQKHGSTRLGLPRDTILEPLTWSPRGMQLSAGALELGKPTSKSAMSTTVAVYVLDITTRHAAALVTYTGKPVPLPVAWAGGGSLIFAKRGRDEGLSQTYLFSTLNARTRAVQPCLAATPPPGYCLNGPIAWNPQRTILAAVASEASGKGGAVLFYRAGERKADIFRADGRVLGLAWSAGGGKLRLVTDRAIEILDAPD